jgi:hypothetical protein
MSEQPAPQNSPKPETPPASSNAPMKSANAAQTSSLNQILAKVQPIATNLWVSSRPTIAQALKATIGLLQSATDQLDRQIQTDKKPVKPLNLEPIQKAANTFWTKAQPIWAKLIGLIRSRLPADVTGKLTDRALSGIVAGLALLLLTITTHLPSGNAAPKPTVVAAKPAARVAPVRPTAPSSSPIAQQFPVDTQGSQTTFPQELTAPGAKSSGSIAQATSPTTIQRTGVGGSPALAERPIAPTSQIDQPTSPIAKPITPIAQSAPPNPIQPPIAPTNPIAQSASPTTTERTGERPLAPTSPIDQPIASIDQPTSPIDQPIAPIDQPIAPIAKPTPIAKPAPAPKLTPNQKLLAKLQTAIDRPNLLQTINPNQTEHSLQITLTPDWTDLPFTEQDTVAQTLFTQAQTLRFKTLELVNGSGDVLARSPVVGNEMVVLLRN